MKQAQAEITATAVVDNPSPPPQSLGSLLVSGSSALGAATLIERGFSFLANLAAARMGGAQVFGAYSVAMTTANNVASYAGAGIGTTANRFSGEYPYGSSGYRGLLKTLGLVSLVSSALAAAILWFASPWFASYLVRNPGLAPLLRLAAISAGAIILLECLRGLLIGQRRFAALLALSALFGGGLVIVLPWSARHSPSQMVVGQAAVALSAIMICVLAAKKLGFTPPPSAVPETPGPRAGSVMRFGAVQLVGMIGINAAGWWIASLVARTDLTLAQAGWYSVASQLRNICGMPAWLISQTAYAQLTENGAQGYGGAGRVTVLSTFVATLVSLLIAGVAAALMPWVVPHLYGKDFAGAEFAATLAVATGLIHMSAAPAAARLTVVSLPLTGIINGAWSVLLIALGTWIIPGGGAAEAAACFLAAHIFAAIAVLFVLLRIHSAPSDLTWVTMPAILGSMLIAGLGWLRACGTHKIAMSAGMLAGTIILLWIAFQHGRKTSAAIRDMSISQIVSGILARCGFPARVPSKY
jgi:O-antigen/teichoic acid export membrane protein